RNRPGREEQTYVPTEQETNDQEERSRRRRARAATRAGQKIPKADALGTQAQLRGKPTHRPQAWPYEGNRTTRERPGSPEGTAKRPQGSSGGLPTVGDEEAQPQAAQVRSACGPRIPRRTSAATRTRHHRHRKSAKAA